MIIVEVNEVDTWIVFASFYNGKIYVLISFGVMYKNDL